MAHLDHSRDPLAAHPLRRTIECACSREEHRFDLAVVDDNRTTTFYERAIVHGDGGVFAGDLHELRLRIARWLRDAETRATLVYTRWDAREAISSLVPVSRILVLKHYAPGEG